MAESERKIAVADVMLVVLVLAGLGIAWAIAGGPAKSDEESPFLLSPVEIGGPQPFSSIEGVGSGDIRDEIDGAQRDVATINDEVTKAIGEGERSTYFGRVIIVQSTSGLGAGAASDEYLTLRAGAGNQSLMAISGWTLQSGITGRSVSLPQGTRVPQTGQVNYEEPIVLAPGEEAVITSGRSPIGVSFKENRCTGYLSQFQSFTPSLEERCPRPDAEVTYASSAVATNDRCLDFLSSMSSCRIETAPLPDDLSSDCKQFITSQITYNGCVANHRSEGGFLLPTWRVYLRYDSPLWKERREVIKLLDEQGKTVDVFVY